MQWILAVLLVYTHSQMLGSLTDVSDRYERDVEHRMPSSLQEFQQRYQRDIRPRARRGYQQQPAPGQFDRARQRPPAQFDSEFDRARQPPREQQGPREGFAPGQFDSEFGRTRQRPDEPSGQFDSQFDRERQGPPRSPAADGFLEGGDPQVTGNFASTTQTTTTHSVGQFGGAGVGVRTAGDMALPSEQWPRFAAPLPPPPRPPPPTPLPTRAPTPPEGIELLPGSQWLPYDILADLRADLGDMPGNMRAPPEE